MKKSILTITLALISAVTIAQSKLIPGQNGKIPDGTEHAKAAKVATVLPAAKKDTVKIDPNLHFDIPKQTAIDMIPGLQAAYLGVTRAENISAKQSDDAKQVAGYILNLIYQKWPDLAPKRAPNQL